MNSWSSNNYHLPRTMSQYLSWRMLYMIRDSIRLRSMSQSCTCGSTSGGRSGYSWWLEPLLQMYQSSPSDRVWLRLRVVKYWNSPRLPSSTGFIYESTDNDMNYSLPSTPPTSSQNTEPKKPSARSRSCVVGKTSICCVFGDSSSSEARVKRTQWREKCAQMPPQRDR